MLKRHLTVFALFAAAGIAVSVLAVFRRKVPCRNP